MKTNIKNQNLQNFQLETTVKNQNNQVFETINSTIQTKIISALEIIQDLIILLLCLGLFAVMFPKITELFSSLIPPLHFQVVTPDILFILILVEIFRLLIIYLQEKEISVAVAVEIAMVSILREVILRGVMEIPNAQTWSICGLLLVLGIIMTIPYLKLILSKTISSSFRQVLTRSNSHLIGNYLSRQNSIKCDNKST